MSIPKLNSKAPLFSLPDEAGVGRALKDYRGKWVLLYFYPKDDTPGCTMEACVLRDSFPRFEKLKAEVLGVSANSESDHYKFKKKHKLPFTLLADTEKEVVQDYGVWQKKKFMGREYMGIARTSFLISPDGKIAKIYEDVKPQNHADEVLADLTGLLKKK